MIYNISLKGNIYEEVLKHLYLLNDRYVPDYSHCLIITTSHSFSYSLKRTFKKACILPKIITIEGIVENFALESGHFEYINFNIKATLNLYKLLKKERPSSITEAAFLFNNLRGGKEKDTTYSSEIVLDQFGFYEKYQDFQKHALEEILTHYTQVIVAGIYITDEISEHIYEIAARRNAPIFIQGLEVNYQPEPEHFLYQTLNFRKKRDLQVVNLGQLNNDTETHLDPSFFPGSKKNGNQRKYDLQLYGTSNEYYLLRYAVTNLLKYYPEVAVVTSNQDLLKKIESELKVRDISLFFPRSYTTHMDGIFLLKLLDLTIFGRTEINLIALFKHPYIYEQNTSIIDYIESVLRGRIKSGFIKKEATAFLKEIESWSESFHQAKNFAEHHLKWVDSLTNRLTREGRRILEFIKMNLPNLNDIYEYKDLFSFFLKKHYFYQNEKHKQYIEVFLPKDASFIAHKNVIMLDCTEEDFPITDPLVMLNLFYITTTKHSIALFNKEKPLSRLFLQIQYSSTQKKETHPKTITPIKKSIIKGEELCIPVEILPKKLTPTMIESLINEPYKFYLRYVLGVREANPIDIKPSYSEFGRILHRVFQSAEKSYFSREKYSQIFFDALEEYIDYPYIKNLWLPRGLKILEQFTIFHNERLDNIVTLENEKVVTLSLSGEMEIFCRLDRLETLKDGTVAIIEFKTGTIPTFKEINDLTKPQLALQGIIFQKGENKTISSMLYCKPSTDKIMIKKIQKPEETITATYTKLQKVLELYTSGKFDFLGGKPKM